MNGILITLAILCIFGAVAVLMSGVGLVDNWRNGHEAIFGVGNIIISVLVIITSMLLMIITSMLLIFNIVITPNEDDAIQGDATYVETLHLTQHGDTVKTYSLQYVDEKCK